MSVAAVYSNIAIGIYTVAIYECSCSIYVAGTDSIVSSVLVFARCAHYVMFVCTYG